MEFSTKIIHTGQSPDLETGAIVPPIYMTSTYIQNSPNSHKGYDYTRAGNPNFTNLETTLAALEDGRYATVFSSGIGATTALFSNLSEQDTIVFANDLYGGTFRLYEKIFKKFGVKLLIVDTQNLKNVEKALAQKPKFIFLESPSNPLLKITDIKTITTLAKKYNVLTIVDNTFATPYFQKPLKLGADVVLHSTTKYLSGHSDVVGGTIITNDKTLDKELKFARMAMGLNPSPFDTWLTSRGIKTLAIRMQKHADNALKVATVLNKHPLVKKVYYPGLNTHKNHSIAKQQMSGFGGMISIEFNLDIEQTKKLISSFKIFKLAESLGAVESLVNHPSSMTHASIPKKQRESQGLKDGLIRFSIGIEDIDDILKDLIQTLKNYSG